VGAETPVTSWTFKNLGSCARSENCQQGSRIVSSASAGFQKRLAHIEAGSYTFTGHIAAIMPASMR
jgi:hypothetical protein